MFESSHKLKFEACLWNTPVGKLMNEGNLFNFRVGTCWGLYGVEENAYDIIFITNNSPGNGHLQDAFEWFEQSCRRDKKDLRVMAISNVRFRKHLIRKRGFSDYQDDNVIKYFK